MTKYQELAKLIIDNNFEIIKEKNIDARSGWNGEDIYINGDGFTFNLSVNGFCFTDEQVDKAIDASKERDCCS